MGANDIVKILLESPEDDPIGPLEPYLGPVEFDQHIRDILDYARQLKEQAMAAGAANLLRDFKPLDIDRAFLTIAVEKYNEELVQPTRIAKLLRKHLHHIWD